MIGMKSFEPLSMPDMRFPVAAWSRRCWRFLKELSGEDAYERYLEHWRTEHGQAGEPPLDRKAFYEREQQRKWERPNRCC